MPLAKTLCNPKKKKQMPSLKRPVDTVWLKIINRKAVLFLAKGGPQKSTNLELPNTWVSRKNLPHGETNVLPFALRKISPWRAKPTLAHHVLVPPLAGCSVERFPSTPAPEILVVQVCETHFRGFYVFWVLGRGINYQILGLITWGLRKIA